jgi:hypothetical protein
MQIIPFDGGNLPAHFKKRSGSLNAEALSGLGGGGYPVISIKGKVFAVVKGGERTVLPNPKDPDSPATSIDAVIIRMNAGTAKVFYLKGYDPESSEKQKPDCYSNDGVTPASDAANAQSKKCATCAHNQFGSARMGKGKACADSKRLAIATADQINEPMLVRVPPASLQSLREFLKTLDNRGADYNQVLTKISFDMDAESPKLAFRPVGILDDKTYAQVTEMMETDLIRDITGGNLGVVHESMAEADVKETAPAEVEEVVEKPKAKVETKAAAKPKVEKKVEPDIVTDDLDIADIDFDD